MKPKRASVHTLPAHLTGGKDRALANALLRVSERTVNQENKKADDVVQSGEEAFDGWKNVIPNPRYSAGKGPKRNNKKKSSKKLKKADDSSLMWGMSGMTSSAVDQQGSYATLRDMYDSYKKSKQNTKTKERIVDPETFEYIPWEERREKKTEKSERVKLPSLKSLHGAPSNRLVEVLQKYASRDQVTNPFKHADVNQHSPSVAAADMVAYYDKQVTYKWNFAKQNQQKISENKRDKKTEHILLPSITSQTKNNFEPSVKERVVRYVNGAVHRKYQNKALYSNRRNAFYIKIHGGEPSQKLPSMVKLERKKEESDRWVARVIIKQTGEAEWYKPYNDSESSSSVIIVPDTRWKRKLGVVEGERERIQREMEKLRFQQQQQIKLNQMKKRLIHENYDVTDPQYRVTKKKQKPHGAPSMFSLAEAAKVSVKHEGKAPNRKGVTGHVPSDESPPTTYLSRVVVPSLNPSQSKLSEQEVNDGLAIGDSRITEQKAPGIKRKEHDRSGRVFLKRGAAVRNDGRQVAPRNENVRLPVLPKQVSLERNKNGKTKSIEKFDKHSSGSDDVTDGDDVINPLMLAHDASATFQAVLNEDNPNILGSNSIEETSGKQDLNTVSPREKKKKNAEFIRYKVIPLPGIKTVSEGGGSDRRPLHPPHKKNRGQERIQGLIDQEKDVVSSVVSHMNKLDQTLHMQEPVGNTDNFKMALSNAVAQAKMVEQEKHHQIPSHLTNGNRKGNLIMKRRVVPPIITTATAAPFGPEPSNLPLVSTRPTSRNGDITSQDDVEVMSLKEKSKKSKHAPKKAKKSQKSIKKTEDAMIDDIILSGDVIIKQRPTPKLLEHSFAASITSMKPSRRVVNMTTQRITQKG